MLDWVERSSSVVLLILALGAFYLLTLVDGQDWSGDFSLYILHAQSLVEGKHYLDTDYLPNQASEFVSPYGYSPVFPLLLSPVYAIFGLDLEVLKWVAVACFCISLWLAAKIFERFMDRRWVFVLILVIGLNPYLWVFTNSIQADFTFTMFSYLSLFLMLFFLNGSGDNSASPGRKITASILIGCSMYLAYGSREIGIVLPLTLLTFDVVCRRRVSLVSIGALGIFVLFAWMQSVWLSASFVPDYFQENLKNLIGREAAATELNHLDFIDLNLNRILDRIIGYRWALQGFWFPSSSNLINMLNDLMFNLFSLLAIGGFIQALLRQITVVEIFLGGYIAVLLLFGAPPTIRYLVPIFPFFLFYGFLFCRQTIFPWLPRLKYALAGAYFLLLATVSLPIMSSMEYPHLELGVTHPEAKAMFNFISEETSADDIILFIKPRIMALMTDRQSSPLPSQVYNDPETVNAIFDALKADYYVDMNLGTWMLPLTESTGPSQCFSSVFSNQYFVVYEYNKQSCI